MYFFNLGLGEFLALFGIASSVVVALYLLDRSRRRLTVATLRFWSAAERPVESTSRRRIHQWPSLLLQLAAIACLLLALAQLRIGSPDTSSRDHVLILDTSAWMAASTTNGTFMDQARAQALAYLDALPAGDRLMLVTADALATPVTAFETDRARLAQAIRSATPGDSALDLAQALDFARGILRRTAQRPGEIAYAGAGRVNRPDALPAPTELTGLRVLPVQGNPQNVGLRKIGLRRGASQADLWTALVSIRNYGRRRHTVDLALTFAGAPVGSRQLQLDPSTEQEAAFEFRTRADGPLDVRIRAAGDAFAGDNQAVIQLPGLPQVAVSVCSDRPDALRPLLAAHPNVAATYHPTAACPPDPGSAIAVYDNFVPPSIPENAKAILIAPPVRTGPIPARTTANNAVVDSWNPDHALTSGLRTQDLRLETTRIFDPQPGDVTIAGTAAGPVIVARTKPQMVALGFHPTQGSLRFELATPLLFANILRWMAADSFRSSELYAASVGAVSVPVAPNTDPAALQVLNEQGAQLPFSLHEGELRFFAGSPGDVRVRAGDTEQVYSLTLPEVGETAWTPPADIPRGVPPPMASLGAGRDIWYWLAIAGGLLLLFEWLRYAPAGLASSGASHKRPHRLPWRFRRAS